MKESRCSYIRPIDGVTRLKRFNCSNITGLENIVHKGSQIVVEVPNDCLVLFTADTFHSGISTWERARGNYSSNLQMLSYIIEDEYLSATENITSIQQQFFCKPTLQVDQIMIKENIHYPGHLVKI